MRWVRSGVSRNRLGGGRGRERENSSLDFGLFVGALGRDGLLLNRGEIVSIIVRLCISVDRFVRSGLLGWGLALTRCDLGLVAIRCWPFLRGTLFAAEFLNMLTARGDQRGR